MVMIIRQTTASTMTPLIMIMMMIDVSETGLVAVSIIVAVVSSSIQLQNVTNVTNNNCKKLFMDIGMAMPKRKEKG